MNKKILGIGNAIVDVFAQVEEGFLKENNLIKGSMKLINEEEFFELKQKIKIDFLKERENLSLKKTIIEEIKDKVPVSHSYRLVYLPLVIKYVVGARS